MTRILRHYLSVDGRRVHYRQAGDGPPLVMLHGSPGDSAVVRDEMLAASEHFTCIAFDTPGFGGSDPLPGDVLQVSDLARATAEAMSALGLPPCRVYGTHTGAAIGAELGAGWPEQVSGVVLEGFPMFTQAETEALFEGYFAPMVADPLGGHLTRTWMRFRDQFTWFPWHSRNVDRRNPVDRPTPEEIDLWVSMFYRSCKTYGPAYKAACYYGDGAHRAAAALAVPAVFMASAEDMLFPHLDRLPPMKPGQRIERLSYDPDAKYKAIVGFVQSLPGGPTASLPSALVLAGDDPAAGFVDAPSGQVFVRAYGAPSRPAVILLHGAPGTGLMLDELARALAGQAYVIVPDLPGSGESEALALDRPVLEVAADAVEAIADAFGLTRFILAGLGCGCSTAAVFAARCDPRLAAVVIGNPPLPDPAAAAAIAPDLELTPEGSHWIKAWLMLRDNEIYQPWYDGRVSAQRTTQGHFDADWLHDRTVALMTSRATYHRLPRAACLCDVAATLEAAEAPVESVDDGKLFDALSARLRSEGDLH
jgi:pimeloyl-ACP methyl ester carboxylesterase